jgi:hypothetical protein
MIRQYFTYLDHVIFDSIKCFFIAHHFLFFCRFTRFCSRTTFISRFCTWPFLWFLPSCCIFGWWCFFGIAISASFLRISLCCYALLGLLFLLLFAFAAFFFLFLRRFSSLELFLLFLSHLCSCLWLDLCDTTFFGLFILT